VNYNQYKYSNKSYLHVLLAQRIQRVIGRPITCDYIHILNNNLLPNIPISSNDITTAEDIFGPDIGSLKGKTTRKIPEAIQGELLLIPTDIFTKYRMVTIALDIRYVNNIPFLVLISRHLRFGTTDGLKNLKNTTFIKPIKQILNIYKERDFKVSLILADRQFESIKTNIAGMGISMNITGQDEHVPEVERYIRTLKERIRCVYNSMPFERIP
jgi:hypothetical protein